MSVNIIVKNITKRFKENEVLTKINLEVKAGEFVCLLGPSGCGKSTLLRIIAGLETPTNGSIIIGDKDVTDVSAAMRNFGIVFQSYALFPNLTAYENVAYGLRNKKLSNDAIKEKVDNLFKMINLSDAQNRYPSQLSGGEQQRVALARALAVNPDFLLLDEPLSALDAKVRLKLRRQICEIQKALGLTTIMVTHDQDEALTMADRIVVMNKANIMQIGTPQEIYNQPANSFVADFIGSINFLKTENQDNTFAVRPENIAFVDKASNNTFKGIITNVEFRGAFSRIGVKISEQDSELVVDIPQETVFSKKYAIGKDVYLSLPKEKILSF